MDISFRKIADLDDAFEDQGRLVEKSDELEKHIEDHGMGFYIIYEHEKGYALRLWNIKTLPQYDGINREFDDFFSSIIQVLKSVARKALEADIASDPDNPSLNTTHALVSAIRDQDVRGMDAFPSGKGGMSKSNKGAVYKVLVYVKPKELLDI